MIFKNWSLALIAVALVAPLSASALGISVTNVSVTGTGTVGGLDNGDIVTFDLLLENATNQDIFGLGIGAYGYDEGDVGSTTDNHLLFVGSTATDTAFANDGSGVIVPTVGILNSGGLANSVTSGVETGAPFPFNTERRALLFNGISTTAANGQGNDDAGVGGGFTGLGADVHIQVSFLTQHLGVVPTTVTLEFGTGQFGNEAIGTGGSVLGFSNASYTVTVVPEPGTALLMGLGLAGLASSRRR